MPPFDDDTGTSSVPETVADTSVSSSPDSTITPDTSSGTQAPETSGDTTASPPDAPVDDRAGLLAAVQKVVQADPKSPAGEGSTAAPDGSSTTETKPDAQAAAAAALENDPTAEELKALAPKTRARIEKLLEQRRAARQEVEALKEPAAKWAQMDGYLRRHELAAADANTLLGVGAALKRGDFKTFLDGVMPYVDLAQQALGMTVAPNLRQKVEAGEMTEEAAKLVTATQVANSRLQGQLKANTDAVAAQRAAESQAATMRTVQSAVEAWEAGLKSRDPDYARMAPEVEAEARLLIAAHGPIKTAEEGVAIAERAYARVKRLFTAGRPAAVASPKQPSGARAVNGARAEPRSMMEAAQAAVERMRGA